MGAHSTRGSLRRTVSSVQERSEAFGAPGSEEVPTLEVRWIRPGPLETSTIDWFSPFVQEIESREDIYLIGPRIQGVSVKIRGGALLDLKIASGNEGVLDVVGQARGRFQAWKKWSFPISPVDEAGVDSADWVRVDKGRRIGRFTFAGGEAALRGSSASGDETTCAVEVTEVTKGEEPWWTMGFEAMGHPDSLKGAIEATATLVFSDPLPGGLELSIVDSMSYPDWLRPTDPGWRP